MMVLDYAPRGLFGMLTPQANTTVEPEMAVMTPPGFAMLTGRLTSGCATVEERLVDYFDRLDQAVQQFGNAPIRSVGVACTGASYLCGPEREARLVDKCSAQIGVPVVTAGQAVVTAMSVLGARRIGLVSPYDPSLAAASQRYWRACGLDVVAIADIHRDSDSFHPIYSLTAQDAMQGLSRLHGADVEAIILLGTGMPTLAALAAMPDVNGIPVVSCLVCTGWLTITHAAGERPDRAGLDSWRYGTSWGGRDRMPVA